MDLLRVLVLSSISPSFRACLLGIERETQQDAYIHTYIHTYVPYLRRERKMATDKEVERSRILKRLTNFYIRRCPEKVEDQDLLNRVVDRLIKHPEKEETLFLTLLKKYPKDVVKIKKKKKKKKKKNTKTDEEENVPDILRPRKTSEKKEEKKEEEINVHTVLANGVEYVDTTKGSGDERATRGDLITVKYKGFLDGGQEHQFDKGTLTFTIGRSEVVKGFDFGVIGMRPGVTRKIFIPSRLGYGARGAPPVIPPDADLFFEIRLVRIGSRRSKRREEEKRKRRNATSNGGTRRRKRRKDDHQNTDNNPSTSYSRASFSNGPIDFGDLSRFD